MCKVSFHLSAKAFRSYTHTLDSPQAICFAVIVGEEIVSLPNEVLRTQTKLQKSDSQPPLCVPQAVFPPRPWYRLS